MTKFKLYILILYSSVCFSQAKNEKEERIPISQFPKVAQNYFNTFALDLNYLKFYKETDDSKISYEAKFKRNKLHYSVEFDTLGKLEDIEIVIKKKHISKTTLESILGYFEEHFDKSRLIKIQKQYVKKTNKSDKQFIQDIVENPNDMHTHFEIIAEVWTNKNHELRELTFNKNGAFEKSRLVTSSSYEHALY